MALAAYIPGTEKAPMVWAAIALLGGVGISLVFYAIYCRLRRVEWLFEADEKKIVWYCTSSSGVVRGRKEVQVVDLSAITQSKSSSEGGSSVYLDLRSGERHRLSAIIPSDEAFLSWAATNYPSVKVILE